MAKKYFLISGECKQLVRNIQLILILFTTKNAIHLVIDLFKMCTIVKQVISMKRTIWVFLLAVMSLGWGTNALASGVKNLKVTATAYNSVRAQTNANPTIAAWGDRLKPGMKVIAVSRDLLGMGLTHGAKVKISGLPGEYTVMDKMNKRWTRKIDIYMGKDIQAAKNWGRRSVTITLI
jgi:3D (Asp-Asp-Asp) domain-containing protein